MLRTLFKDSNEIYNTSYRLMVMNAYCQDILFDVYLDSIKIQTCVTTQCLQTLLSYIPKEYDLIEKNIYSYYKILH